MLRIVSKNHWVNFARSLIETGEIDPPYVLISKAGEQYGDEWAERFALHYFLFYDLGGAARCAYDSTPFWSYVANGYHLFRRGTSRRHFRGDKGKNAILRLQKCGDTAGDVFSAIYQNDYGKLVKHLERNFQGCEIGPYFAWKLMDIFDRCLGRPVHLSLDDALKYLPETPRRGAKTFFPDKTLTTVLMDVVRTISDLPAPGVEGCPCGLPEAETILCAIYGENKGTYHFGMDLDHRHKELAAFPDLIKLLPPLQDWSQYASGPLDA